MFIEGVLGESDTAPPVMMPPPGSGLPPSIGFPIHVREDGTISIPLIPDLLVRGKSIKEVEKQINKAFKAGDEAILKPHARIIVTLLLRRGSQISAVELAAELDEAELRFGKDHPTTKKLRRKLNAMSR